MTPNMLRYLRDRADGLDPRARCADWHDRAGVTRTERTLVKRKMLDGQLRLTRLAREALK